MYSFADGGRFEEKTVLGFTQLKGKTLDYMSLPIFERHRFTMEKMRELFSWYHGEMVERNL